MSTTTKHRHYLILYLKVYFDYYVKIFKKSNSSIYPSSSLKQIKNVCSEDIPNTVNLRADIFMKRLKLNMYNDRM